MAAFPAMRGLGVYAYFWPAPAGEASSLVVAGKPGQQRALTGARPDAGRRPGANYVSGIRNMRARR